MKIIIEEDGKIILSITSDGEARYIIRSPRLRDNVGKYKTDDDLHVLGLVMFFLTGHNSREYLRRRINERDVLQDHKRSS